MYVLRLEMKYCVCDILRLEIMHCVCKYILPLKTYIASGNHIYIYIYIIYIARGTAMLRLYAIRCVSKIYCV